MGLLHDDSTVLLFFSRRNLNFALVYVYDAGFVAVITVVHLPQVGGSLNGDVFYGTNYQTCLVAVVKATTVAERPTNLRSTGVKEKENRR